MSRTLDQNYLQRQQSHDISVDLNQHDYGVEAATFVPSSTELVLLCLDHLRNLLRNSTSTDSTTPASSFSSLDTDYITIACWALKRCFTEESSPLLCKSNDAFFDFTTHNRENADPSLPKVLRKKNVHRAKNFDSSDSKTATLPSLEAMKKEILFNNVNEDPTEKKEMELVDLLYPYDDAHPSNAHRFYVAAGLSCCDPLTLGEVVTAGLAGLQARSRIAAEQDLIQSPLFEQYLSAVRSKGFFDTNTKHDAAENNDEDPQGAYEERFRKVVTKFRHKLSIKVDQSTDSDSAAYCAATLYRQQQRLLQNTTEVDEQQQSLHCANFPVPAAYVRKTAPDHRVYPSIPGVSSRQLEPSESVVSASQYYAHPVDMKEAEKFKNAGNAHMQRKEYQEASDCYTEALKLAPAGPNSHVYFSNRAAAAVSMKCFAQAIIDSERSLALKPDYGKAHARLGLAHFLTCNYRAAVEAYTVALKYEPDNQSSRNYLEKSAKRLAEVDGDASSQQLISPSFSVVSEMEKSKRVAPMADEREAEKYKIKGNSLMAIREYVAAQEAYSKAIQLNPSGSQAHVYYSNRAAAYCYLERYADAEQDSMLSLQLQPTYGKAHARLGLSRFFLKDYAGAIVAYEKSLEYDPDNAASKSYLAKAQAKLEAGVKGVE